MNWKLVTLVVTAAVLAYLMSFAGCAIVPGAVTSSPVLHPDGSTTLKITGDFTLAMVAKDGYQGKSGGACLVFQQSENRVSCKTDSMCTNTFPGGYAYCGPDFASDARTGEEIKTCWYRPGKQPDYCDVGKERELNVVYRTPSVSPSVVAIQGPVRWRVVTCQNVGAWTVDPADPAGSPAKPPCARSDAQEVFDKRTRYGGWWSSP